MKKQALLVNLERYLGVVALAASVFLTMDVVWSVAATAQTIPGDASMVQDLWTMAKNASPPVACFCVYLWLGERSDRRKLQSERDGLLERVLIALHNTAGSVDDLVKLLSGQRQG